MRIEWRDPPPGPRHLPAPGELVEALGRRPGRWACVWVAPTANAARQAKGRLRRRLAGAQDGFELLVRGREVFARLV